MAVRAKVRFLLIRLGEPVGICVVRLRRRMLVVLVRRCVDLHVEGSDEKAIIPGRGEVKVVSGGGRYHHAGKRASKAGTMEGWMMAKLMSLFAFARKQQSTYAVVVAGRRRDR